MATRRNVYAKAGILAELKALRQRQREVRSNQEAYVPGTTRRYRDGQKKKKQLQKLLRSL